MVTLCDDFGFLKNEGIWPEDLQHTGALSIFMCLTVPDLPSLRARELQYVSREGLEQLLATQCPSLPLTGPQVCDSTDAFHAVTRYTEH